MKFERHPKNAPGPFYVIKELCLACLAPEAVAPDLIAHEEPNYHCYFKKQPATSTELDRAIKAVIVGCCGAVRYAGNDPAILDRLSEWNPDACDNFSPGDPEPEK
jgi:hypothetical protein